MNNKEHPDTVLYGVYEQVAWERSIAEEQLRILGFSLGERVTCKKKHTFTEHNNSRTVHAIAICSECGEQLHSDMNFCPCCGRKIVDD